MASEAVETKLSVSKTIDKDRKSRPSQSPKSRQEAIKQAIKTDQIDAGELEKYVELEGGNPVDSIDLEGEELDAEELEEEKLYNVTHPTGDKLRDKVRKLLSDSMDKEEEGIKGRDEIESIAYAIENEMFKKYDCKTDNDYRKKYRDLNFNLKDIKNKSLRHNILNKCIKLNDLLSMSNQDLANDELKTKRKKIQDKMTRDAQPSNKLTATTTQFKCGKCKQRKCTYFQMQTRSADEPLTTFVTCVNCQNRWKF